MSDTKAYFLFTFYSSLLQQRSPNPTGHDLSYQTNELKVLKKHGTSRCYLRSKKGEFKLFVLIFVDYSQKNDHGHLPYKGGFLFGNLEPDSVLHILSCNSQKSKGPANSVGSPEMLAADEAIGQRKSLVKAKRELLGAEIKLYVVFWFKRLVLDSFSFLIRSYQCICREGSSIMIKFATKNLFPMIRVLRKIDLADPAMKPGNNLTQTPQMLLEYWCSSIKFKNAIIESYNVSTG